MIFRKSSERGHNLISWLDSWHSFSFGHYYDPKWQGFHQLLVVNEDFIAEKMGFGTHPHRDMEILTFVISGELRHQDSMGNIGFIRPGDIQVMSAGTGITHSEHNNLASEKTHLLQIWVHPQQAGLTPRYDQKKIFSPLEFNFLKVIAAPFNEKTEGVSLNAHAQFWLGRYNKAEKIVFKPSLFSQYWIQVIKGGININELTLMTGDAVGIENKEEVILTIEEDGAEFLIIEVEK